ncbi:MAG: 2,3-bisphosphoglycerate-independent phosphoglycerate mutase, partial [Desulfovibrionaceae bacterium]|nr:2,3-bisphosphoglycerate-independent phosphoglycerate mutase [Desulfovibrionaceae bacterium]
MSAPKVKPTFLIILDGLGLAPAGEGNAVSLAHTPTLDKVLTHRNFCGLRCSGRDVGLPTGFMGNSEVGHMNIGAGRIVYQDMTRIDIAVEENALARNQVLLDLMAAVRSRGGKLHLFGLLSDGGVHSHLRHLFALAELAAQNSLPVRVHAFMDGRDTEPTSGAGFIQNLLDKLKTLPDASLASLIGRYYAMDRDQHWERTLEAWEALTHGKGRRVSDAVAAARDAYAAGETDEFMKPRLVCADGVSPELIRDNDGVFFFNFRADRARQLTRCFQAGEFDFFDRGKRPDLAGFATMTPYDESMPLPTAFVHEGIPLVLGEFLSSLGLTQLRIAETEKYAHVTYFFNGGREEPFTGEERRLIPSPRDVATYDLKPGMSAEEVTETLLKEWSARKYDFVVCNFANPDMVGHTGVIPAAIEALQCVDRCLRKICAFGEEHGCRLIITADHGNVEEMLTHEHTPETSHSKNPVPFVILDEVPYLRKEGRLADIAPTILDLWNMEKP